jgi:hypothetical protein
MWNVFTIDKIIGEMTRNNENSTPTIPTDYRDMTVTRTMPTSSVALSLSLNDIDAEYELNDEGQDSDMSDDEDIMGHDI